MSPFPQNIEAVTLIPGTVTRNRAYDQTVEEWLEEYDTGVPVIPAAWTRGNASASASAELGAAGVQRIRGHINFCSAANVHDIRAEPLKLFYDTFRTTKENSLALVLTDKISELEYVAFFNISTSPQRKSRKIRIGHMGYFFPAKRSKFRKFWQKYICPTEKVWGSVYRRLPSRLRKLIFTGSAGLAMDAKGVEYFKVKDFKVLQL